MSLVEAAHTYHDIVNTQLDIIYVVVVAYFFLSHSLIMTFIAFVVTKKKFLVAVRRKGKDKEKYKFLHLSYFIILL